MEEAEHKHEESEKHREKSKEKSREEFLARESGGISDPEVESGG